ncbi:MAG: hypothetical protein KBD21_04795 [Candidatus Pacebacteria bacterium]|nr:hypothetical protein [Candidatus Paceibacterota bacterium]
MPLPPLHTLVVPLFAAITLAILGTMLNPGYVLTLDMAWPEQLTLAWNTDGFNNTLPLHALLALLGVALPSWLVQKVVLVGLFFALLYLPYRFLPYLTSHTGRIFAGTLYALNPFVYARLLAGQWTVLLGYALLPVVLFALVRMVENPNRRSALVLASACLLIGSVSMHYFYIAILVSMAWLGVHVGTALRTGHTLQVWSLIRTALLSACIVLSVSMYWIAPALARPAPIETRFDVAHFEGFAASENELVPTLLNVLVLGGFWAEGMQWRYDFVWPQDTLMFWIAALATLVLVCYGAYRFLRNTQTRFVGLLLVALMGAAYVLALGAWGGIFTSFNLWMYAHLPGWSGLRDSHKLAGVLALLYALFAGVAIDAILNRLRTRASIVRVCVTLSLGCIPLCFGLYEWGGFHRQLTPVWYPDSWYAARDILSTLPPEEKVLSLPWRGYYSLTFTEQRIVANLTPDFFGTDRVLAGRSVEVGAVYDQEVDSQYRSLDTLIDTAPTLSADAVQTTYAKHHIRHLLIVRNANTEDPWLAPPHTDGTATPADAAVLEALLQIPHRNVFASDELELYTFTYE